MEPRCPKCKTEALATPTGRATRTLRCGRCRGTWLPYDEARLDAVAGLLQNDSTMRPGAAEDARTGLCPLGHGILIRARVELGVSAFFLERCAECAGIWFDKGEWNELAGTHLMENLDRLWDPSWRARIRQEQREAEAHAQLVATLGPDLRRALDEVADQLQDASPSLRHTALAYLSDRVDPTSS